MKDILHYPLPNMNCVVDDQLQQDIVLIVDKSLCQFIGKLGATRYPIANSLLGTAINNFFESIYLITTNKMFTKHQIDKVIFVAELLKYHFYHIPSSITTNQ